MNLPGLALILLVGFLLGVALLTVYTVRTLSRPPRRGYAYALARNLPADPRELRFLDPFGGGTERLGATFEQFTFRSRGHDLPVWDVRGCHDAGPTIILVHGWGDSRVVSLCRAPTLLRLSRRLILWDLPGHGDTARNSRCSLGMREPDDLAALIETVADRPLVLYGHSLGAGVAIETAARLGPDAVAGVVAEAPYARPLTPARNVMRLARLPYRLNLPLAMAILRPRFDRAARAADLRMPLLVIHGDNDLVCPVADARSIAAAANATLAVVPGGGHVDLFTSDALRPRTEAAITAFLAGLPASMPRCLVP
jgi:pimeloyl-ACP methyl ester carboxylesterase